jgi:tetratricopeptide (TPR) repeat protein
VVEGLVEEKPDAGSQRLLLAACLLRALAHAGTPAAVRGMTPLASDLAGQLRPELTRQVKQLGDRAVPGLLLSRHDSSSEVRGWANSQLEALGKRTPGDMVQTSDHQVIADVLRAYASLKDTDALAVVLSFVDSDRAAVRSAAREATLAYGQEAAWKIREAYAVLTGESAPEAATAAELAKKLFDAYDRYRQGEVYALLDDGLAKQKAHDLQGAIAAFDEALARQPLLDRRAEMAPAYAEYGESIVTRDRAAAVASLRKAVRLDEYGERTKHVQSELLTLQGEDLLSQGIPDTQPFEQAVALDGNNGRARAELDGLRAQVVSGRSRAYRLAGAGALLAAALVAIAVLGRRRRAGGVLR